ncbi:hypothetical protein DMZ48_02915 [Robertkochia solimangrovi]|nr:hypothetical protein DMZ48_02915 [Robertkochia solimangrovi]
MTSSYAQVIYMQYRVVPADKEQEFVQRETKYWSKVAKAAIDNGNLQGWSLWHKVGVTNTDAPNYVFLNIYESVDKMKPELVFSEDNMKNLGVPMSQAETNSFTTVPFDYIMQLEDMVPGENQFVLVNYAMPKDFNGFITENKDLWKPFHEKNIQAKTMGMSSWGMMSVIYPQGMQARFSVLTWDGFNDLTSVMNYLRYEPDAEVPQEWQAIFDKTKMGEIIPEGFEWRIIYEKVMSLSADD